MKQKYVKPELISEVLLEGDVLKMSTDTDNSYVQSQSLFRPKGRGFDISDIL